LPFNAANAEGEAPLEDPVAIAPTTGEFATSEGVVGPRSVRELVALGAGLPFNCKALLWVVVGIEMYGES
jgi:hypothetical protein